MGHAERFPFKIVQPQLGRGSLMPIVPIRLLAGSRTVESEGLLDTGAAVNVLPYQTGLALGAIWDAQGDKIQLAGNLAKHEARILVAHAQVGTFDPVKLVFACTLAENAPLLLGQTNFFMAFDAFFSRTEKFVELSLRS